MDSVCRFSKLMFCLLYIGSPFCVGWRILLQGTKLSIHSVSEVASGEYIMIIIRIVKIIIITIINNN